MKARDIMVTDVVTVGPETTVREVAQILSDKRISGVPVVDAGGRLLGIVSEGDLIRRAELGSERRRSWWLELLAPTDALAHDFVKSHGVRVADIMSTHVVTAAEDASLADIATLLERNRIKRVPIVRDGRVVGIVSRANLVQVIASTSREAPAVPESDREIRERVMQHIRAQPWGLPWLLTVTVENGVVTLWGPIVSEDARAAIRVAAEETPGVREVKDHLYPWYPAAA